MKLLDLLLFDASNRDGFDAFATMCFEEGFGVDAVRFIAASVGFDVLGRDDGRVMTGIDGLTGPVVSGATGFEQDGGWFVVGEELCKLRS